MKRIYIAKGYNSWTNNQVAEAFNSEQEAGAFVQGLTDPSIKTIGYKSTVDLVNFLIDNGVKL